METPRATGLGAVFNARGRDKKKPAPMPASAPDTVPEVMPETMPVLRRETKPESTREATPDRTRERQPAEVPATSAAAAPQGSESEEEALVVRNTAVYLPVAVLARLRQCAAQRQLTYTDLLIDAFDELTEEQLLTACGHKPRAGGGMPRGRRGAVRGQGGVQVQLRLDQVQRAWLDEQVEHLGAPSRSGLVAAVFDAWLPAS